MPVNEGQVNKLLGEYDDVDKMVVLLSTNKEVQAAKGRDHYGEQENMMMWM